MCLIQDKKEILTPKHVFIPTLTMTTGQAVDDVAALTFFMTQYTELKFTREEKDQMLAPQGHCNMAWKDDQDLENEYVGRLAKWVSSPEMEKYRYTGDDNHSISKRFIRGFWFRHLDIDLGWTDAHKDLAYDLIQCMISYFPHQREKPETLLNNHKLFANVADEHKYEKYDAKEQKLHKDDITLEKYMKEFQRMVADI